MKKRKSLKAELLSESKSPNCDLTDAAGGNDVLSRMISATTSSGRQSENLTWPSQVEDTSFSMESWRKNTRRVRVGDAGI